MFRDAFDIGIPENRRSCFAAIGTLQAIHARKNLFVPRVKKLVYIFFLTQVGQKIFVLLAMAGRLVELSLVFGIHVGVADQ